VVVVAWNSAAAIESCLRAALAAGPAEVVVVDNNSQDTTASLVTQRFPSVRLIPLAENTGFAHGCNVGIACTGAPYVLFLNDDAELTPTYLSVLLATLQAMPQAASAVGKLLRGPGQPATLDSAGLVLHRYALRPQDRGQGELDRGQYDTPQTLFGPSGAAALYRRRALDSACTATDPSPFDAKLFAYYEDVDLAWRLGRQGWTHLYVPTAIAYHGRRGPRHKPRAIAAQAFVNRYRVWRKNEPLGKFLAYAPVALAWEAARLARLCCKNPRLVKDILKTSLRGRSAP
jgi:GT2 family glycosyltransferase